jgi:hypothetical protein
MTTYVQLTRMAPAVLVSTARALCAMLAGTPGSGELTTPLVPAGSAPDTEPTWFITSGPIEDTFALAMSDPEVMYHCCQAMGLETTLEECEGLLGACVIDPREPFEILAEMGLERADVVLPPPPPEVPLTPADEAALANP